MFCPEFQSRVLLPKRIFVKGKMCQGIAMCRGIAINPIRYFETHSNVYLKGPDAGVGSRCGYEFRLRSHFVHIFSLTLLIGDIEGNSPLETNFETSANRIYIKESSFLHMIRRKDVVQLFVEEMSDEVSTTIIKSQFPHSHL
eukprot:TRINITY_DN15337_c1_g1_i2.p1 TRINITY_DN15337_c1_g1~~TRINITY_DN15337_c1_g1_i2.p1  ORF type:complete len:162 (+),score=19.55 TRINITY_DN15337_c1_g1_i2:62-487(+)